MNLRQVFIGVLFSAVYVLAVAQPAIPSSGQAVAGLEAFDAVMQSTIAKHGYPGGTLAVSYQGRMVLNKAYGFAKRTQDTNIPMAVDQRMRIASMSKWITGIALLKAVEQGKLDLDQPLAEILEWSQKASDYTDPRVLRITVRNLAQNHAGWTIDRARDPMFEASPPCPNGAEKWFGQQRLSSDPGALFSYSNINFCLAQLALEKVTGQSYVEFVKTNIAQPLGIGSWQFASASAREDEPDYVSNFRPYSESFFQSIGAAGAWTSSASDYVRFLSAVRGYQGKPLLKPELAAQMIRPPSAGDSAGKSVFYGLGTNVRVFGGSRFNAWHLGSLNGTTSFGASYDSGWTVFLVFNQRLPNETRDAAATELDRAINDAINKSTRPTGQISP
jgi:D-alanyl-D-alanine carboxypeptidase